MKLYESTKLDVYKKLLRILGEYSKTVATSNIGKLFLAAADQGMKILPTDKAALNIINCCLVEEEVAESIQKILNIRFSNLPIECCPLIKGAPSHAAARWARGDMVSDQVTSLIDWEATGKSGHWVDADGKKVTLLDLSKGDK